MNSKLTINSISKVIFRNIILIMLITIVGGLLGGLYAHHKKQTSYEANRYMMVEHDYTGDHANEQAMADLSLTKTYAKIIDSRDVAEQARKNLPINLKKKYSAKDIQAMVNTDPVDQSLVIKVGTMSGSAKDSVKIVNSVTNAAAKEIKEMAPSAGTVKLFSKARVSDAVSHTSPSTKKYTLLGTAVGFLIGMVIAFSITTWKHLI